MKKIAKQIIAYALILAMIVDCSINYLPSNFFGKVQAATEETEELDPEYIEYDSTVEDSLQALIDRISADTDNDCSGTIRFTKNYTENIMIPPNTNIILDLNGHVLEPADQGGTFVNNVSVYGSLIVRNGTMDGQSQSNARGINIFGGGKVTLKKATIKNYTAEGNGAGVMVAEKASFTLGTDGVITGNTAKKGYGGGVYIYNAVTSAYNADKELIFTRWADFGKGEISDNTAAYGGGVCIYRAEGATEEEPLFFKNTVISDNHADNMGGGIYAEGKVSIFLSGSLTNNTTGEDENTETTAGGGLYCAQPSIFLSDGATIESNVAYYGGAIYMKEVSGLDGSIVRIKAGTLSNNIAGKRGGAIYYSEDTPNASHNAAALELNGVTVSGNSSGEYGGAVYTYNKTNVDVVGSNIINNTTVQQGAGLYLRSDSGNNISTINITNSNFEGNTLISPDNNRYGGGLYIYKNSVTTIKGATFKSNVDAYQGGGLYCHDNNTITITDCVFEENNLRANSGNASGGGLYMTGGNTSTITNTQFIKNGSVDYSCGSGGLYLGGGTHELKDCLVDSNITFNNSGAGIGNSGTLTVSGTTKISNNIIYGNSNTGGGGISGGTVILKDDCVIENNSSYYRGGGISCTQITIQDRANIKGNIVRSGGGGGVSAAEITMTGGIVEDNKSLNGSGGGFFNDTTMRNSVFSGGIIRNNTASSDGGAIYIGSTNGTSSANSLPATITLTDRITISGNTAKNGGAIRIGNRARVVVNKGATITNNTATSTGGGIAVSNASLHVFADSGAYALEINGGTVRNNDALQGRDIHINFNYDANWVRPYYKMLAAKDMDNATTAASWGLEVESKYITEAINNKTYIDELAAANDKTNYPALCYTFIDKAEKVAKVGSTYFPSVQDAVDAIQKGTVSGTLVELLKDTYEDVTIHANMDISLDLNGHYISGRTKSVITTETGAKLLIKDSSGDNSGQIRDGHGTKDRTNGTGGTSIYGGGIFVKGEGSVVTLESGTICNNGANYGSAVYVGYRGTFIMNGGVIEENGHPTDNANYGAAGAVCVYFSGQNAASNTANVSSFYMNGGIIRNNRSCGVYSQADYSQVIIKGGEISGNRYSGNGAGIRVNQGANSPIVKSLYVENATISNNVATGTNSGGGIYVSVADCTDNVIELKNTLISGNTAYQGAGIYLAKGRMILGEDVTIIKNIANLNGGGVYLGGNRLIMGGGQIYDNIALGYAKDLYLAKDTYFENTPGASVDYRNVSQMGISYNAWYDAAKDYYYVEKDLIPSEASDFEIHNYMELFYEVTNPDSASYNTTSGNFNKIPVITMLIAVGLPSADSAVAKIVLDNGDELYFPSLMSAVTKASSMTSETPVHVELLRDVIESITCAANTPVIVDLKGHKVSAPQGATSVFYINGGNLTLMSNDEDGESFIVPSEYEESDVTRAVYVQGGKFTMGKNLVISGFTYNGDGAAIYEAWGANINSENVSSEVYIEGGRIENCTAINGGAVFVNSDNNNSKLKFHMTDGVIKNCQSLTHGGAIYLKSTQSADAPEFYVIGGQLINNTADSDQDNNGVGGAIYYNGGNVSNDNDDLQIYNVQIKNNTAYNGGGIYCDYPGNINHHCIIGKEGYETVISGNTARNSSGGLHLVSISNHLTYVDIDNLLVENNEAKASYGAGNINTAWLSIKNSAFNHNTAAVEYGGIQVTSAELLMDGCEIAYNTSIKGTYGGGLLLNANAQNLNGDDNPAKRVVKNTEVHHNTSNNGAGIVIGANRDYTFEKVDVHDNTARSSCGGVEFTGADNVVKTYTFKDCKIRDNYAYGSNGAFAVVNIGNVYFTFENTEITGNSANSNGVGSFAPRYDTTPIEFEFKGNTVIANNTARTGNVGGIDFNNVSKIVFDDGVKIANNVSVKGHSGAFHIKSGDKPIISTDLQINKVIFERNQAKNEGGALFLESYSDEPMKATISGATFENNSAGTNGGAICLKGNDKLELPPGPKLIIKNNSVIRGNSAGGNGGGIYNYRRCNETVVSDGSLITENTAAGFGGGVYVASLDTSFTLAEGGRLYGNKANLGQDVYVEYQSTHRTSNVSLIDTANMFSASDDRNVKGWLNETTEKTTKLALEYLPATANLPITLSYSEKKDCAIYNNQIYRSVQDAIDALCDNGGVGTVYLIDNCVESIVISPEADMVLNLNGYTLKGGGTSAVTVKGKVRIIDEDPSEAAVTVDGVVYGSQKDENNNRLEGTITGMSAVAGGGVNVNGGSAVLESGKISDCQAGSNKNDSKYGGAGVYISSGSFTLKGSGKICDNTAFHSSAVLVDTAASSFIMEGGEICGNKSSSNGVVYNNGGTIKIYGGEIHDNTANQGGAIYNNSGKTTIIGNGTSVPKIYNNIGAERGGAVFVNAGNVQIGQSEITRNKTTKPKHVIVDAKDNVSVSAGGGVYVNGGNLDIIEGAYIAENNAVRGGGIYQTLGTVNIMGGTITGNTAQLGGGVAQNPFPTNASTSVNVSKGAIYGNVSTMTSAGNDFYSAYEGTKNYPQCLTNQNNTPKLSLIAAYNMGLDNYDVWKDDTYAYSNPFYTGTDHDGTYLGEGRYITEKVTGTNLQLTASYQGVGAGSGLNTIFKISNVKIEQQNAQNHEELVDGITTGGGDFDCGLKGYENAEAREVTARQMLNKLGPSDNLYEMDKTYIYNQEEYHYIWYNGREYEEHQLVEWWPGNDFSADNTLIRSFDRLTYSLHSTVAITGNEERETYTYNAWLRMVLPCSEAEASFVTKDMGLTQYVIKSVVVDGKEMQVLEGFWQRTVDNENKTKDISENVMIDIHGMKNGDTLKPTFDMWIEGNVENETNPAHCESKTLTVSAAPKFNISLDYSKVDKDTAFSHEGYFDVVTGQEVSKNYVGPNPIIHGVILGYGVTVSMYNEPAGKKLKGIEYPDKSLEFDIDLKGDIYCEGELVTDAGTIAPYIWGYKENVKSDNGKALGDSAYDRNMNWNDEDDLEEDKTTNYAYNAAPFNIGNNAKSCYNGGSWHIDGHQPVAGESSTKIHVKVMDYQFAADSEINTNYNPNQNADGKNSVIFNSNDVKPFTAGYIQVLMPLDVDESKLNGYVELNMKAVASGLNVRSVSGQVPEDIEGSGLSEEKMLSNLKALNDDFFDYTDPYMLRGEYGGYSDLPAIAVNERRYTDNISSVSTTFYSGGDGYDNAISKWNYFKDNKREMLSDNNGKGETPLNSYVYVNGRVDFSSMTYYTNNLEDDPGHYYRNDPLYHTDNYSELGTETNYVTAMNILQKFDSKVYTPISMPAIVNYPVSTKDIFLKSEDGTTGFVISNNDEKTSWTDEPITWKYNLTILYAAKPDGSDWIYADVSDNPKFNYEGHASEPGTYNDGGVADMDLHREENLIYFETMDDLNAYFGVDEEGNPKGKCVAILYEIRDCCLRSGRSINTDAMLKVTKDFMYTGQTYCTTNDVKAWYTYRPHYKYYYKGMKGTNLKDHLYEFNWISVDTETENKKENNGIMPYGLGLDAGVSYTSDEEFAYVYNEKAKDDSNDSVSGKVMVSYKDDYAKTQYRNGSKISGTHTGADKGNSLLLYTMDTSIDIYTADYVEGSNNTIRKQTYDISNNERVAKFQVSSYMEISSAAKKTEIVENGTLSADITIELLIPEHLSYRQGSLVYKYANDDGTPLLDGNGDIRCYYNEGDLNWGTPELVDAYDEKGNKIGTKLILKTHVSNIDMGLPDVYFDCNIGDIYDINNDITKNSSYTLKAAICAEYEEYNITAAERHESTTEINVVLKSDIGIAKDVDKSITEVGEDFKYKLSYSNNIDQPAAIELLDILPYNGDERATDFTGGYRVKSIRVRFTESATMEDFISLENPLRYKINQKNTGNVLTLSDNLTSMRSSGIPIPIESSTVDYEGKYIDYVIADNSDMVQYAFNADGTVKDSGIMFYAKYNPVGRERVYVEITLSPMKYGGTNISDLLRSGKEGVNKELVQTGECTYENRFVFRNGNNTVSPSNPISVNTANRVISGVVWMDQNQNGLYDSKQISDAYENDSDRKDSILEYPIAGVEAKLYEATTDIDGNVIIGNIATDVLGNEVKTVITDINGRYTFENLREGSYVVVFSDENNDYSVSTDDELHKHPINFNSLSTSSMDYCSLNNGNKAISIYDSANNSKLNGAAIYTTIQMPSLADIHYGPYRSNNWNLALYYDDIKVEKVWKNFRDPKVEEGTKIIYDIVGTIENDGQKTEYYTGELEMRYDGENTVGHYIEKVNGVVVREQDLDIVTSFDTEEKTKFYWTLAENLILQSRTADGEIHYSFKERGVYDKNGLEKSEDFITDIEIIDDPEEGYYSFQAVNTKKEYFLSVEKVIYVDTFAHGKNAKDEQQQFIFKVERFDSLLDLQNNVDVKDTFYTNLNCTDKYTPANNESYVDGTSIDSKNKKVNTSMGYQYSFEGYIGKSYIMVTEPGWYKITEISSWSATDYDYVVGSNTYLNGIKGADAYIDYSVEKSVGNYVAFSIGDTYNGDLKYSEFPTARFTNIESEYAFRSAQAFTENNIKLP